MDDTSTMEAALLEMAALLDEAVEDILDHADGARGFSAAIRRFTPFGQTADNDLIAGALMKATHQLQSAALGIGLVSKAFRNAHIIDPLEDEGTAAQSDLQEDFINTGIATDSQV